jgi:hypothetical protein
MRIGKDEFEASGSEEFVQKKLDEFKALGGFGRKSAGASLPAGVSLKDGPLFVNTNLFRLRQDRELRRVYGATDKNGKILYLLPPKEGADRTIGEAFLLLLLGYKHMKGHERVRVHRLKMGLEKSGHGSLRVIEIARPMIKEGLIKLYGERRGAKYALTENVGAKEAEKLFDQALEDSFPNVPET